MITSAEAATRQLVERLRDRLASAGAQDVQLIETHLSWLLLAGSHAWKFKKPLRLDFVDFGTLEKRRTACAEELRINRRSAPELYLDVVPVTGTADAPRLAGTGQAIEWAVHMRRFPQDALLSNRAARGELAPAQIDALARELAEFQAHAAVAAPASPWGRMTDLLRLARDNFPPLAERLASTPLATTLDALGQWTEREGERLAPLIETRRAQGHVREGHGDLHLANLLWLNGRARLFDAIEFDPQLRWIDAGSEIAFVFMDLHAHDLAPLAWRFLNAWLECSGDFGALARLPFDAVYRALVRAKVAALRLAQIEDATRRAKAQAEMEGYVRLAARLAAPPRPWLALTMGVSGSGKSSQTQGLIEQRRMVRVRADVERKRLFGLAPEASSAQVPGGIYDSTTSERVFAKLLQLARELLLIGQSVLVDATFIRQARRAPFIELAEELDVPWRILAFDAPEDVLRERVRARQAAGGDASEADVVVLESQLAHRQPLDAHELKHALRIDTRAPVDWSQWTHALPVFRNP